MIKCSEDEGTLSVVGARGMGAYDELRSLSQSFSTSQKNSIATVGHFLGSGNNTGTSRVPKGSQGHLQHGIAWVASESKVRL